MAGQLQISLSRRFIGALVRRATVTTSAPFERKIRLAPPLKSDFGPPMPFRRVSAISAAIAAFFIVICAVAMTTPFASRVNLQVRAERSKLWRRGWLGNGHVFSDLDSDGLAVGWVRFSRELSLCRPDQA
jgi:hypothetical protein